jgi:hypothetical protein
VAQSTVAANPVVRSSQRRFNSTITVTLKDANNNPVSGKTVSLARTAESSTISTVSGPSDTNGVVAFLVKDAVVRAALYTATDTTTR